MDVLTCNLNEAFDIIKANANLGLSFFLSSQPGVGKTSISSQLADSLGYNFRRIELSLRDVTDIIGIPWVNGEVSDYHPFKWAYDLTVPSEKGTVILFDDLTVASQQVQNAALSIFLDRMIGQRKLADNVICLAAGNRQEDQTGVEAMPRALENRFIHLRIVCDVDVWVQWAIKKDIDPLIVAYHRKTLNNLNRFDPDSKDQAQATPRTWEFANRIFRNMKGMPEALTQKALAGTIGTGVSMEFLAFARIADRMISPEDIVKAPKKVQLPDDSDVDLHLLVMTALETYVVKNPKVYKEAITYALRIPAEFGAILYGSILHILKRELKPADFMKVTINSPEMQEATAKWAEICLQ